MNVGEPGTPPMLFYSDPEQLMNHLIETNGMDAVMGMAEVAAWCDAPARAIGRKDVRLPPKTLDEMFACATNEPEREAIRTAMFGSVMDVVDRFLPDKERHAMLRGMLAFLSVNSTYRGPYTPGSAMCLAFALTAPGTQMIRKVKGGIGALCAHVQRLLEAHGGEVRLHAKVEEILTEGGRVTGVRLVDGEVIDAPIVVSNLDPTLTFTKLMDPAVVPDALRDRVNAIDHRAAYVQIHFALDGLPEFVDQYAVINDGVAARQPRGVQLTRADAAGLRGVRARARCPSRRRSASRSRACSTRRSRPRASTRRAPTPSTSRSPGRARSRTGSPT